MYNLSLPLSEKKVMNSRFFIAFLILAAAAVPLNAQTAVPGLCPTGYGAYSGGCGALLSPGSTDGNYTYSYTYDLTPASGSGVVLSNLLTAAGEGTHLSWYTGGSGEWIATTNSVNPIPYPAPAQTDIDVDVNYAIDFNLTGFELNTVVISGSWTADDIGFGLILNGVSLAGNSSSQGGVLPIANDDDNPPDLPWSTTYSFTLNSSTPGVTFNPGVNTLVFSIQQSDNYYDGLDVSALSGTGALTPEPGSILLIAAGLGMLALRRRSA
jgi:hypothetical protein